MNNSLKIARMSSGMTQTQLAVKADVSVGIVNSLERGTREDTKLSTMIRISNALGKPVEEVFSSFFAKEF